MPEEQDKPIEQVETPQVDSQVQEQEIDYKAKFEALQTDFDKKKTEVAGLDKKVSDLTNSFTEYRTAKETESEKLQREAIEKQRADEERITSLTTKETELLNKETALNIKLKAVELKVSLEDIELLKLNTVEQVEAYAIKIAEIKAIGGAETAKDIENKLSGKRDSLNNDGKQTEQLTPLEMKIINRR